MEQANHFEFDLQSSVGTNETHGVFSGGRSALKCLENGPIFGKFRDIKSGIIHFGDMAYLSDGMRAEAEYISALEKCYSTAISLLERKELWGIHIDQILEFYYQVLAQSDEIISIGKRVLPTRESEFEKYRLPNINASDQEAMQKAARIGLENALTTIPAQVGV